MERKDIKLNLGCGRCILPGYINVDLYETGQEVFADDITKLNRLSKDVKRGSVSEIYSSHSLMCVPEIKLIPVLKLWRSFLRRGGKLIIETTDLDKQISEYNRDIKNSEIVVHSIFGDNMQDGAGLRYQFNLYLLKLWLKRAGFKSVRKIRQRKDSKHLLKYNLTVEAIK